MHSFHQLFMNITPHLVSISLDVEFHRPPTASYTSSIGEPRHVLIPFDQYGRPNKFAQIFLQHF